MNSNAIKLRVPSFVASLKEAGLKSVLISLHAADEALSDAITRAPGTHRRTVEGIHAALDAGLIVILNCCVDTANVSHLPDHAHFVREQFVTRHPDNPVRMVNYSQPGTYYDFDEYKRRLVDLEVARPMLNQAARTLEAAGVLLEIAGTCGFPSCVVRDIADLVPWRPKQTMDADHLRSRADDPALCRACAAREQCIGPRREYMEIHGTRGLQPFEHIPSSDWYLRLSQLPIGDAWAMGLYDTP
jgi:MoaA/NifB/PqqE/SkfB family radical SAM enzyme